jgi:adenylate cyclase
MNLLERFLQLGVHPNEEPALGAGAGDRWPDLRVRVGIASGPLIAGVIGRRRFSYDLWGDTVNTAARMAGIAAPGSVEITDATAALLGDSAVVERHDAIEVKGKGVMTTFRLLAITPRVRAGR